MKKQVGLVLFEYVPVDHPGGEPVYRVGQIRNSLEWSIGQELTRKQVWEILRRTKVREVEVIVKGVDS